jgi:hypothetical protein
MSEIETVQSDVTFSGSYAEEPLELGKLMLYQLSYSRSMTYGWRTSFRCPSDLSSDGETIARNESAWK